MNVGLPRRVLINTIDNTAFNLYSRLRPPSTQSRFAVYKPKPRVGVLNLDNADFKCPGQLG